MQLLLVYSMLLLGVILPIGLLLLWSRRLPVYRTLAGQRSESLAPLVVLLLAAALWSVAYALELLARSPVAVQHLHRLAFTGIALVPPSLLLVTLALAFRYRASGRAWAALVTLARMSDMEVVAEGVETEEQEATLRELRCHQAQGYLYSRPVPAEMVPELLRNQLPLEKPADP